MRPDQPFVKPRESSPADRGTTCPHHDLFVLGRDLESIYDDADRIENNAYCVRVSRLVNQSLLRKMFVRQQTRCSPRTSRPGDQPTSRPTCARSR